MWKWKEEEKMQLESPPWGEQLRAGEGQTRREQEGPCSLKPVCSLEGQGKTWPHAACSQLPWKGGQEGLTHEALWSFP